MKKKLIGIAFVLFTLFSAGTVFAQPMRDTYYVQPERQAYAPATRSNEVNTFSGAVDAVLGVLRQLVLVIGAIALIYFLWGVTQFIKNADDQGKREEGRQQMMWGLVGLFVMVSVWGLVGVLQGTFPLNTNTPAFPSF